MSGHELDEDGAAVVDIRGPELEATKLRLGWVDRLRGLAVVLMVLDHVLVQLDPGSVLRLSVTRAALPLFLFCSAVVWRGRVSSRRWPQLLAAAGAEWVLDIWLGMSRPGIVLLICGLLAFVTCCPVVGARPGLAGALGLIQALYLPLQWGGYQPGLVLAWWCLGRLMCAGAWDGNHELRGIGRSLPSWLGRIGRRPLAWYVGHLAVLAVAVSL